MSTTLIIPGLGSSGAAHWQTWFESQIPNSRRVVQDDWNQAQLPEWASRVRRDIVQANGPVFLAAHSFGALAAVQAAHDHSNRIAGVLLVAPADPKTFGVEDVLPTESLAFPTIVVASTNDPWMSFEAAIRWSNRWGADLINLGESGHINADAGFGPWPEGLGLLLRLREEAKIRDSSQRLAARLKSPPPTLPSRRRGARPLLGSNTESRDVDKAAQYLRAAGWAVTPPVSRVLGAR